MKPLREFIFTFIYLYLFSRYLSSKTRPNPYLPGRTGRGGSEGGRETHCPPHHLVNPAFLFRWYRYTQSVR